MARTAEARKVLRELDAELAASSERSGQTLSGPPLSVPSSTPSPGIPRSEHSGAYRLEVNYLKAVRHSSGVLTATGTAVKSGSRAAFTEGTVTDASGALVATASSTLLVIDLAHQVRT